MTFKQAKNSTKDVILARFDEVGDDYPALWAAAIAHVRTLELGDNTLVEAVVDSAFEDAGEELESADDVYSDDWIDDFEDHIDGTANLN